MNISEIIKITTKEFNNSQKEHEIKYGDEFVLIGSGSSLDSLAIVNFLTKLDKNLNTKLKKDFDVINKLFSLEKDKVTILDLKKMLDNNS